MGLKRDVKTARQENSSGGMKWRRQELCDICPRFLEMEIKNKIIMPQPVGQRVMLTLLLFDVSISMLLF